MARATVVLDCSALSHPSAEAVDRLARLQLNLRRRGCAVRLVNASECLIDLIAFAGLAETLGIEPDRQTEQGEDSGGVQKERELGNATG